MKEEVANVLRVSSKEAEQSVDKLMRYFQEMGNEEDITLLNKVIR